LVIIITVVINHLYPGYLQLYILHNKHVRHCQPIFSEGSPALVLLKS